MGGIQSWFPRSMALLTFLVTAALAYDAGVSFVTLLLRSVTAAAVIGVITFGIIWYLLHILGNLTYSSEGGPQDGDWEKDWSTGTNSRRMTKEIPDSAEEPVEDFVPRQIQANLEDLLAQDPARAAELMRKMQWEEGE